MKLLCVDIGGTAIKYAVSDENLNLSHKKKYDAYFDNYKTELKQTLISSLSVYHGELLSQGIHLDGVAMSITGDINTNTCYLEGTCGSIPGWVDIDFKKLVNDTLDSNYEVYALNDANAAALAEYSVGNAKNYKNAIIYTIGTGIGGGIIVDGKILEGSRGFAGNIGHMAITKTEKPCHCGNIGCFEYVASTRALLREVKNSGYDIEDGKTLFEKQKDDYILKSIIEKFFDYHGIALASLIHIFNPEVVVVGGGISAQGQWFVDKISDCAKKYTLPHFYNGVSFKIAKAGNDAGLIGAAKYFMDRR